MIVPVNHMSHQFHGADFRSFGQHGQEHHNGGFGHFINNFARQADGFARQQATSSIANSLNTLSSTPSMFAAGGQNPSVQSTQALGSDIYALIPTLSHAPGQAQAVRSVATNFQQLTQDVGDGNTAAAQTDLSSLQAQLSRLLPSSRSPGLVQQVASDTNYLQSALNQAGPNYAVNDANTLLSQGAQQASSLPPGIAEAVQQINGGISSVAARVGSTNLPPQVQYAVQQLVQGAGQLNNDLSNSDTGAAEQDVSYLTAIAGSLSQGAGNQYGIKGGLHATAEALSQLTQQMQPNGLTQYLQPQTTMGHPPMPPICLAANC